MKRYKIQNLVYALSFFLIATLTGCSDNAEDKTTKKESTSKIASTPKIEVVKNENATETKVEEKDTKKLKNESYYFSYGIKSAYDQNARPANEDASVRVKPRTNIDANIHIRTPYEKIQVSMLINKLSMNFLIKCSACHSDYANGVIGPSLLGKSSNYIYEKILEFKTGTKTNVLMTDLVKMMDKKEIKELADEIFNFNEKLNQMRNK